MNTYLSSDLIESYTTSASYATSYSENYSNTFSTAGNDEGNDISAQERTASFTQESISTSNSARTTYEHGDPYQSKIISTIFTTEENTEIAESSNSYLSVFNTITSSVSKYGSSTTEYQNSENRTVTQARHNAFKYFEIKESEIKGGSSLDKGTDVSRTNDYLVSRTWSISVEHEATKSINRTLSEYSITKSSTTRTVTHKEGLTTSATGVTFINGETQPTTFSDTFKTDTINIYITDTESTDPPFEYNPTFLPISVKFAVTWATTSCPASYIISLPVHNGQYYVTSTLSTLAKHHTVILTTTDGTTDALNTELGGPPMETTDSKNMGYKYKTVYKAGLNERLALTSAGSDSTDYKYNITLFNKITNGLKHTVKKLLPGNSVTSQIPLRTSEGTLENDDTYVSHLDTSDFMSTYTLPYTSFVNFTPEDKVTYFDPYQEKPKTQQTTTIHSETAEFVTTTLFTTVTRFGKASHTRTVTTDIQTTEFQLENEQQKIKKTFNILSTQTIGRDGSSRTTTASNTSTYESPDYSSYKTTQSTRLVEDDNLLGDYKETSNFNILNSLRLETYGKDDTLRPFIQDSYGPGAKSYAGFSGMLLPPIGANLGTSKPGLFGFKHAGYALSVNTTILGGLHNHIFTTLVNQQQETRTTTRKITNSNMSYASSMNPESVKNAFMFSLYTYKYGTTKNNTSEKWRQRYNEITAVTLGTKNGSYYLKNADFKFKNSDLSYEETSYTLINSISAPLLSSNFNRFYKDLSENYLKWVSADFIKSDAFLLGGIGVDGSSPKTAYLAQTMNIDQSYPLTVSENISESTEETFINQSGKTFAGTKVTTYIDHNIEKIENSSTTEISNNEFIRTVFYKDPETSWQNSKITIHPWDIPIGASYGSGIVTKKGRAPETYKSTLNPRADESDHKTALRYQSDFDQPETTDYTEYRKSLYSTQYDAPWLGTYWDPQ